MADPKVDEEAFGRRLKRLYEVWEENDGWGDPKCTSMVVVAGKASEDLRYLKSVALHLHLFGYELPETVLAFTRRSIHFFGSSKKTNLVGTLFEACKKSVGLDLVLHTKAKDNDGGEQMDSLLQAIKEADENPAIIGVLNKEKPDGKIAELWQSKVSASNLGTTDMTQGLASVFAVKDKDEIQNVKKSAYLSAIVLRSYAVPHLEGIIDEEKKITHKKVADKIENAITNPEKINLKLKAESVDIAYPPIVQSGGKYDFKLNAQSSESNLTYDVILLSVGSRYKMYCSNISRTLMVDPTKTQEAQYKALLDAQQNAINALKPGKPMSDAYEAVVQTLKDKGLEALLDKLPKNVGFGMGLEFRESTCLLNAKNSLPVKEGMVFNVSVGLSDLQKDEPEEGKPNTYALLVADTVIVTSDSDNSAEKEKERIATHHSAKSWTDIAYFFKDEDQEEKPKADSKSRTADQFKSSNLRSNLDQFREQEEQRKRQKTNQEDLLTKVNNETLRLLNKNKANGPANGGGGRKVSEVVSYRNLREIPPSSRMAIEVDQRNETVLLPIYGTLVPFHILTIKNATNNQDGDHSFVRINFNFGPAFEPCTRFPQSMLIKELSFRSADTRHAAKVVQEIKLLRAGVSQREREQAERATLKEQEKLIKAKGRSYVLPEVWIRPAFIGKGRKVTGTLESHSNGFRYQNPKGEQLDVMYRNIKHAFFQPADNEMITLVHFHLHDPIMLGKKKTQDVQFYTEVMEATQALEGGRKSMYDPDEIEEEQRERAMRAKINKQFQSWVKRVQTDVWERDYPELNLEFEVPFRELGFHGVPHRETGFMMPSVHALVELTQTPFTVITMSEVNVVNLERVGFNLRNFDMTLVFKDLTKDVVRIDAIESQSLDTIRDWLGGLDIKYYESKINLNWKPILKSIIADPEQFIEDGGWNFLDQDAGSDEEDDEEEEGDIEFNPGSGSEEEEESDEGSSEDESVVDSDEEGSEEFSGEEDLEDEEEGLSWDELEKEAARDDRGKQFSDDDDDGDDRGKRKRGGGGGAVKKRRH